MIVSYVELGSSDYRVDSEGIESGGVLMPVHAVVMKSSISHPCIALTEHAGFPLDKARGREREKGA